VAATGDAAAEEEDAAEGIDTLNTCTGAQYTRLLDAVLSCGPLASLDLSLLCRQVWAGQQLAAGLSPCLAQFFARRPSCSNLVSPQLLLLALPPFTSRPSHPRRATRCVASGARACCCSTAPARSRGWRAACAACAWPTTL
jgi:hypothetical protein